MTELKRVAPIQNSGNTAQKLQITSTDGLKFGLGFWVAWAIITLFFIPALACIAVLFLPMLTGVSFP